MINRRAFLSSVAAATSLRAQKISGVSGPSQRLAALPVSGRVLPVLTRSGGNLRHGVYQETILTPTSVRQNPPHHLFSLVMPGDARGMEAQPLLIPSVTIADGTVHDLCICATMSNNVYAFDANDGSPLWMVRLGPPIKGSFAIDSYQINDKWGILSTPVIDGQILYAVAWSSPDGTSANGTHYLYAVDVRTGALVKPPLVVAVSANGVQRKQRAALTSVDGVVFIAFATIQESNPAAHGFVTAVDIATWKKTAEWNATPAGSGGGIWQSGGGLSADADGFLYALTSNGSFDGVQNFGESFVKLKYDGISLVPVDWFSPWLDSVRAAANGPDWGDSDLGSSGPVVIPELGMVFGSGKDGVLYAVDWRGMSKTTLADIASGANYKKLKHPPIWFTYYQPGSPYPVSPVSLDVNYAGRTHNQHATPVAWNSSGGWRMYNWGENGNLRAWSIGADGTVRFLANGAEVASPQRPGMPGGFLALSSNGGANGLIWAQVPQGDANTTLTPGKLYCYDAQTFGKYSDGTGSIPLLWQTDNGLHPKFNVPVISGGKIYAPTYNGTVEVYGQ
jgi:hypothetical protein